MAQLTADKSVEPFARLWDWKDSHFVASHLELRINARNQMQSICNQNREKTLKFTSLPGRDLGFSCVYKILLIPTRWCRWAWASDPAERG